MSFLPFFLFTERPGSIRTGGGREQECFLWSVVARQGRQTGLTANYIFLLYLLKERFSTLESSKDYSVCWFLIPNKLEMLVVMFMLLLALMAFTFEK